MMAMCPRNVARVVGLTLSDGGRGSPDRTTVGVVTGAPAFE
jgi:hypothetical protein